MFSKRSFTGNILDNTYSHLKSQLTFECSYSIVNGSLTKKRSDKMLSVLYDHYLLKKKT
jgi:hypothetical protein